jgi:hypothetical protein
MKVGNKLHYLREVEGTLRGLGRAMDTTGNHSINQKRAGQNDQPVLSLADRERRTTAYDQRDTHAAGALFQSASGYFVDDPEGFATELISDIGAYENKLDLWLVSGAERFRRDPELREALVTIARHEDSRMCLVLLGAILENPGLAERLLQVLKPQPERSRRR